MQTRQYQTFSFIQKAGLRDGRYFLVVSFVHLVVALAYRNILGIDIEADPVRNSWNWFWQTLPAEALRDNLLISIWNLHAQPPLYNLYGALFIKAAHPHYLQWIHSANMILGALLSGMVFFVLLQFTRQQMFSFYTALILALNPALFLYEAYILYELLVAFLVVLCINCLALFSIRKHSFYLGAFILS
jgi:hypothetical protein